MRTFDATAVLLVLAVACAVSSCAKRSQDALKDGDATVQVDAYGIARDSKQHIDARLEAASHLTQAQKKQLQTELLKEVPGDGNLRTRDTILLLGSIGDMAAVERLQEFKKHSSYEIPDKINTVATYAIEEIRKRELKTNR